MLIDNPRLRIDTLPQQLAESIGPFFRQIFTENINLPALGHQKDAILVDHSPSQFHYYFAYLLRFAFLVEPHLGDLRQRNTFISFEGEILDVVDNEILAINPQMFFAKKLGARQEKIRRSAA